MAGRHGTRLRYNEGCRCGDCTEANRVYFRRRREAKLLAPAAIDSLTAAGASQDVADLPHLGPVESGVQAEISDLAAELRPGLAQVALALARVMDNPKAINQKAAAAKVLAGLLDKLRSASAGGHRRSLAVVRAMSTRGLDT
jgi:hypothetical protein